ncbi:Zinc finger-XS domain, partial [Sesbania bispinosa]
MVNGRYMLRNPRTELEAVLQNHGVLKPIILILGHGGIQIWLKSQACGIMELEELLEIPGRHKMLTVRDQLVEEMEGPNASQKSHETRKKIRWFRKFFEILDGLTVEQINEPERQWHCPACQGGPGAIDWYRGLQPLMTHAKTKGSKRVKMHRELAELLDEELRRRGTSVIPAGEVFGKWKGLKEEEKDHEIVWPPMVIIQNTKLEQDENEK